MKSLYSASACARPCVPPSRYQLSAISSFAFAMYSLVSYVFMSVFKVRRATSNRLRSTSAMALSNSTLSGCSVSLVMGFSYFLRRAQEALSRLSTAAVKIRFRPKDVIGNSNSHRRRVPRDRLHIHECRAWIRRVKNRRPCDDPVTPRPHGLSDVFRVDSPVNLDRQRN